MTPYLAPKNNTVPEMPHLIESAIPIMSIIGAFGPPPGVRVSFGNGSLSRCDLLMAHTVADTQRHQLSTTFLPLFPGLGKQQGCHHNEMESNDTFSLFVATL